MADLNTTEQLFIGKLTEIVLANLANEIFGVKELALKSGMSRSGLNRRLRKLVGKNINQFIRDIRLQKALEILKSKSVTVSEVAYMVGFSTPEYFNTCFHEYYGYSPGKIKKEGLGSSEQNSFIDDTVKQEPKIPSRQVFTSTKTTVLIVLALILTGAIVLYPKIFERDQFYGLSSSDKRITVAVMPFQNLTHDTIWNIWQDGIQASLIISLSGSEELSVRQVETVRSLLQSRGNTDKASLTSTAVGKISRKLDADVLVCGSLLQAGSKIRINAKLFGPNNGEILKSFETEWPASEDMIFNIIDSLTQQVRNFLIISKLARAETNPSHFTPVPDISPEAYRYCISGDKAFAKLDYRSAIEMYLQAIKIDSAIYNLNLAISKAYYNQDQYEKAKEWCLRYYSKLDKLGMEDKINASFWYVFLFETPNESIRYLKQLIDLDDKNPGTYYKLGDKYLIICQYEDAIKAFEKALEIYKEWDVKPPWIGNYSELGEAYHKTGNFRKENNLYKKAEKDFPDDPLLSYQRAILSLTLGDSVEANLYIRKCKSNWEENAWSEARIAANLAMIYSEAGMADQAEKYFRKSLLLEPERPVRLYYLAWFLINNDRNINEALELIDKALQSDPDNYNYLHAKGWGLYKQGKNDEALSKLETADSLKPIYNHLLYLHLKEVKEAVAGIN